MAASERTTSSGTNPTTERSSAPDVPGTTTGGTPSGTDDGPHHRATRPRPWLGGRIGSVEILAALLMLIVVLRGPLADLLAMPALATWTTVFVSVMVQAVPFLVFGVLLSALIAVFVPRSFWARALPKHPALA
ncbi:hypothetical protein AB0K29_11220, partial [Micromonospora humida]